MRVPARSVSSARISASLISLEVAAEHIHHGSLSTATETSDTAKGIGGCVPRCLIHATNAHERKIQLEEES